MTTRLRDALSDKDFTLPGRRNVDTIFTNPKRQELFGHPVLCIMGGDAADFMQDGLKYLFEKSLQGRLKKVLPEHLYQRLTDEMCRANDHVRASEKSLIRMEIEERQLTFRSEVVDAVDPSEVLDEFTSDLEGKTTRHADEFADFMQFWAKLQQNLSPELFDELTIFTQRLRRHVQELDLLLLYKRRTVEQLRSHKADGQALMMKSPVR